MKSTCAMDWFEHNTVGMIRIQSGTVVFDRVFNEHAKITPDLRRKAIELSSLPSLPRLVFVEAALNPSLSAVVRFIGNVALVVVCEPGLSLTVRDRIGRLTEDDVHHLGGGLSNYGDVFNTFEMPRVDASEDRCTGTEVSIFLNDSFDFVFSRESEQLRVAYCRNFASRFAFLEHDGSKVAGAEGYLINDNERQELSVKFSRMVDALEMKAFMNLANSPIANPPWERQASARTDRPTHSSSIEAP